MKPPVFDTLIRRVSEWAQATEYIQAAILVGSRARSTNSIDLYSDLDIILFTDKTGQLNEDPAWLSDLGDIWLVEPNFTSAGDIEWIVIFDEGVKVDIVITMANSHFNLRQLLINSPYLPVIRRGYHILFSRLETTDLKDAFLIQEIMRQKLDSGEFTSRLNQILILAHRAAKFIERRDFWRGQSILNEIRGHLLWLIEEHAQLGVHNGVDTWYEGRYIELWAAPKVKKAFPDLFASYTYGNMARALRKSLELTQLLASEIAQANGIPYPTAGQKATFNWLLR